MRKILVLLSALVCCSSAFGQGAKPPRITLTPADENPWPIDVPCLPAQENPVAWNEPGEAFATDNFPGFPDLPCTPDKKLSSSPDNTELSDEEIPWILVRNRFFEVLTNATRAKSLLILKNLERFRVATEQFTDVRMPPVAPPIIVLIFESTAEFRQFVRSDEIDGLMVPLANRPGLIVMPAEGDHRYAMHIIRHEYVHVLTASRSTDYPVWYREGIAEVLASSEFTGTEVGAAGNEKIIFVPPLYRISTTYKTESYTRLIRDDYDPHTGPIGSDSYAQYWLLVHYIAFSAEMKPKLHEYLRIYSDGVSSQKAFKKAFGMSASKFERKKLKAYRQAVPSYQLTLDLSQVDFDFQIAWAEDADITRILDEIERGIINNEDK